MYARIVAVDLFPGPYARKMNIDRVKGYPITRHQQNAKTQNIVTKK